MHSTLHISSVILVMTWTLNINKVLIDNPTLTLEGCTITTIWIPEFKIIGTVQMFVYYV